MFIVLRNNAVIKTNCYKKFDAAKKEAIIEATMVRCKAHKDAIHKKQTMNGRMGRYLRIDLGLKSKCIIEVISLEVL